MGAELKQKITTTHIRNAAVDTLASQCKKCRDYAKPHRKCKDFANNTIILTIQNHTNTMMYSQNNLLVIIQCITHSPSRVPTKNTKITKQITNRCKMNGHYRSFCLKIRNSGLFRVKRNINRNFSPKHHRRLMRN